MIGLVPGWGGATLLPKLIGPENAVQVIILNALNTYNANKSSVEANEQSFYYAQQKYNVGAISTFDYNNAKTRLQNAQGNLVQAKYDYVFKLKVLDFYQGKELKF